VQKEQIGDLLPRRLKAARALAGLTMVELGKATDLSTDKLYRFERGDQVPDALELGALAVATGQTVGYFLDEAAA